MTARILQLQSVYPNLHRLRSRCIRAAFSSENCIFLQSVVSNIMFLIHVFYVSTRTNKRLELEAFDIVLGQGVRHFINKVYCYYCCSDSQISQITKYLDNNYNDGINLHPKNVRQPISSLVFFIQWCEAGLQTFAPCTSIANTLLWGL